jgi:hypothetical protein
MKPYWSTALLVVWLGGIDWFSPLRAAAGTEARKSSPLAADRRVEFIRDIKPLLESSCIKCHAHGQKKGAFQIDSRELFLKGGESGPAAKPGQSADSLVVKLVAGMDPDKIMPAKGPPLTANQVALLRAWIDQGMAWPAEVKLNRGVQAPWEPRRVALPPNRSGSSHPIDRLLQPYFAKHGMTPPQPVVDRVFARRVYLDVTGLLPTPEELNRFLADRRLDKRARLVRQLLGMHQRYAEHWLTFWNDALRNDYKGAGYIDGGRKQITPWLFGALATNTPFDRFVAQLVNPTEHSEGFAKGIVWRGVVNASQTPQVQAAQNISQVFLGINLKCASCHDSFISDWKLADAYGLASIYADEPLELVRCDKPTGELAQRKFLYAPLGQVEDTTNRTERLESLARILTNPQNGRLTRTMVNRLWAKFLGRGLVEPVDEMDNPPWNPDLLDWLAVDLAEHNYDLKRTMALILTSRAYQLPALGLDQQNQDQFVFRGPTVRRLTAEEYADALASLTGLWRTLPANTDVDFAAGAERSRREAPPSKWIWATADADQAAPPQTVYFRKTFVLPDVPEEAAVVLTADNRFSLYVNGKDAGSNDKWEKPKVIDIRPHLVQGANVLAVSALNDALSKEDSSPNPAGLFVQARLRRLPEATRRAARSRWDFGSDRTWLCTTNRSDGWEKPDFDPAGWRPAWELGAADLAPWKLAANLAASWSSAAQYGRVRAALANNDPLLAGLGRPNREQVVTGRSPVATTLQALELTNGATLADWLKRGAERLLAGRHVSARGLVSRLYLHGLGRQPTPAELDLAQANVREPIQAQAVEDLLWAMSMLPEFQLIY